MDSFFKSLKKDTRYFAGIFLLWLILFNIHRLVFSALNHEMLSDPWIVTSAIGAALKLDAATAGWFCLILCLVLIVARTLQNLMYSRWAFSPVKSSQIGTTVLLIFLYGLIATGECAVYPEWKSKLNFKAIMTVVQPGELLTVATPGQIFGWTILWLAISSAMVWIFLKYPVRQLAVNSRNTGAAVTLLFLFAVTARGGIGTTPVSLASAYFSANPIANDLAVNPGWNAFFQFGNSWDVFTRGNPFEFMPSKEAQKQIDDLYRKSENEKLTKKIGQNANDTMPILTIDRPNVILIILESWSADMIAPIVPGPEEFTPAFNKLVANGILFTSFYANGNRSQQGVTSLLTGFPALGLVAAADDSGFVQKLPGIPRRMKEYGYSSKFIYGGALEFGNITTVVTSAGFDAMRTGSDSFPADLRRGAQGVHDGEIVDTVLEECDRMAAPFLLSFYTLSSHAPYDYPGSAEATPDPSKREQPYGNSVRYTDSAIGSFMEKARRHSWYDRTLFILVADHGHNSWRDLPSWHPEFRKIPLLMTGPVINEKLRGKKVETIGSQVDLPATLLEQIGIPADDFAWSKNLFNRATPHFAQYELNYGFGFVSPDGAVVFDKSANQPIYATGSTRSIQQGILAGKAMTQCVMQSFIDGMTMTRHCLAPSLLDSEQSEEHTLQQAPE